MSAFFVALATVKNPEKFQEYAQKVAETFTPYGGKMAMRGRVVEALAGSADHQATAIITFPDSDAISTWYNSAEYQALIPLREEAADITIISHSAF